MDLSPTLRHLIILVGMYACGLINVAFADDRQVIDYSYDASGNLLEKTTDVTVASLPPVISSILPSIVRRNTSTLITLDGNYLKNLQISTDYSGLSVSDVVSANSRLTFNLTVSAEVPLGVHSLFFSTLSGQNSQTIQVLPQLPEMVIRPSPLVLVAGKESEVTFGISDIDVVDHQITLSVADQSIATTPETLLIIAAGERFPSAMPGITGLQTGTTKLTLSSQELATQVLTLIVANPYQPPAGTQVNVSSDVLGLLLPSNSPDINVLGPFTSLLPVFYTPVIEVDAGVQQFQLSSPLAIVYGSAFTEIRPGVVAAGSTATLTIKGHGLSDVTDLNILPADGITLGGIQINPAGTEITAAVTIASGVSFSIRSVQLLTADSEIKPVSPEVRQLYVGGKFPIIESIDPVVASRLTKQTLNVTGQYFDGDVKVQIIPSDDIAIGNRVTVNGNQTKLCVDLNIDEYAGLGERVISIETLSGATTRASLPANTITIANAIAAEVAVTSKPLGLVVGASSTVMQTVSLLSPEISIVLGAGVSAVQPLKSAVNTVITLSIDGFGLDNVTAVVFEPDQGVTVGSPQIAGDGRSLTVDVIIDADAQTTTRQLSVVSAGTNISFINAEFSRFAVLGSEPKINYISPNFIVAGSSSIISIHGEEFDSVDTVRFEPSQGLVVSVPQINTEKTFITVQLIAEPGAQRGTRTLILHADSAESSAEPSASNQLNIVDAEMLVINSSLVSSLVGILKADDIVNTAGRNYTIESNLLGVVMPQQETVISSSYYSLPLSVVKGSYIYSIYPDALQTGTISPLTISGAGLQDVTAIEFIPADGLSQQSSFIINAAATEVAVDITVAADAEKAVRRIVVHQNDNLDNALPYVKPEYSIVTIAGGLPVIDSISPVLQVANSQFELLVRGRELQEITAVHAYDSNGSLESLISFGTPVVNIDATELRVAVAVDRLVTAGEKAIVLTVPTGQTSKTATSVNTLTIDTLID